MTAPRDQIEIKVRQWATYADEDLELARHALGMGAKCSTRLVAYHAQQCAEKYLKAYLVHRQVDFPFTHNISLLLELCGESGAWVTELTDAEILTRFGVKARYPGEDAEVPMEKAQQAVDIAARVRELVRQALAAEGVSLQA